jgi:hypothetical protein
VSLDDKKPWNLDGTEATTLTQEPEAADPKGSIEAEAWWCLRADALWLYFGLIRYLGFQVSLVEHPMRWCGAA